MSSTGYGTGWICNYVRAFGNQPLMLLSLLLDPLLLALEQDPILKDKFMGLELGKMLLSRLPFTLYNSNWHKQGPPGS